MAMPELPANWGERALSELFGSAARATLLTWLCGTPEMPAHVREIARQTSLPYTAARREVSRLEGLGMLRAETVGRSKRYHLVAGFPLLPGLCQAIRRAVGVVPRLQALLADEPVDVAFIYGSMASGSDGAGSDADLLVVGEIDSLHLSNLCGAAESETGREISPVSYRPGEFGQMLREGSTFLSSVLRGPMIFVKGDEDFLREIAERGAHPTAAPDAG
jgi:predicted nucleotidyltransferase